jgi:P-type Ca2+ transporter type 2C
MTENKETYKIGLSSDEARHRLTEHGHNSLPEKPPTSVLVRLVKQFESPLIYILLFALIIDLIIWYTEGATGYPVEGIAIGIILVINAVLGVFQEGKSESALAKLKAMATPQSWVVRDGKLQHVDTNLIVPGDIVRVEGGDRIPADGKIHSDDGVQIDESILTGESIPVEKEKGQEVFSGTLLQRGKAYIEVVTTGEESAMGRLATMIGGIEQGKTPLEQKLEVFAKQVSKLVLGIAIFVLIGGTWIQGTAEFGHVMLFAVALAVAAIPEGLPAVLTLTLALGVERMAKRKAVVRRLSAVEALGSVTVIATDKTGTLTENEMNVRGIESSDKENLIRAMVLANDADLDSGAGDALELGLLNFAVGKSIALREMRRAFPRTSTKPFDSSYKFMRVSVTDGGDVVSFLKGAPEVILDRCEISDSERVQWNSKIESAASEGFRVLAFAMGTDEAEEGLRFLGIALLWDPPRPEVPEAVKLAYDAGIKIVMVTGDHPSTALAVARAIGINAKGVITGDKISSMSDDELRSAAYDMGVLARVTPEHKLRLVEVLQSGGAVVAMTGDGVNDAPALKKADVGVAMGQRGSDVSREVADIVLVDDNFASIISAVEEGRNIFENIQKFIRFLFSTNMAFVLIIVFGSFGSFLMGLEDERGLLLLPMTAVQMLWINIITDGPPALALGFDRNPGVMLLDPRPPGQPLLDRASIIFVGVTGIVKALFGGVILLYGWWREVEPVVTRTVMFLFQSIAELLIAYPARRISLAPLRNNFLHVSVFGGIAVQIGVVYFPPLRDMLGLKDPGWQGLLFMSLAAIVVWFSAELVTRHEARKAAFHNHG